MLLIVNKWVKKYR